MKVPQYLYDNYPKFTDTFDQINITIRALDDCRINELYPKINDKVLARTVFRFAVYNQIVLHRVLDLSKGILKAWENEFISVGFILLRTLDENVSVIYDTNTRLDKLISAGDFLGIYKLIYSLQYGTRIKERIKEAVSDEMKITGNDALELSEKEIEEAYTAPQILSVMDRLSKTFHNHRKIYEFLCEYAHPNYDGLLGLYGVWKDEFTIDISNKNGISEENVDKFFTAFEYFLKMFVEGYDGIVRKFDQLTELSNEDLRKKGRSDEAYKYPNQ